MIFCKDLYEEIEMILPKFKIEPGDLWDNRIFSFVYQEFKYFGSVREVYDKSYIRVTLEGPDNNLVKDLYCVDDFWEMFNDFMDSNVKMDTQET